MSTIPVKRNVIGQWKKDRVPPNQQNPVQILTCFSLLPGCFHSGNVILFSVLIGLTQQKGHFFNQATVGEARSLPPGLSTEC